MEDAKINSYRLLVETIRYPNKKLRKKLIHGHQYKCGAIFTGIPVDVNNRPLSPSEPFVVVTGSQFTLEPHKLSPGQLVSVTGIPFTANTTHGNKIVEEKHIKVTETIKTLRISGQNIINFIGSSDLFSGIGSGKAKMLWNHFGKSLYHHLDSGNIEAIMEVLSEASSKTLIDGWKSHVKNVELSDVLAWLDKYDINWRLGQDIYLFYGQHTIKQITENPYRLTLFTDFNKADTIAIGALKYPIDHNYRLLAAVQEAFRRAYTKEGKTALTKQQLSKRLNTILEDKILANQAIDLCQHHDATMFYTLNDLLCMPGAYLMEMNIATYLCKLLMTDFRSQQNLNLLDEDNSNHEIQEYITEFETSERIKLECKQIEAIFKAVSNRFSIISGGAGTGKTTVLKAIYFVLRKLNPNIAIYQSALSGKASKRMNEATNEESYTCARLIKSSNIKNEKSQPLLVIDEASMVDLVTLHSLIEKLPADMRVILIGDNFQLPPVGPGTIFHAFIREGACLIPRITTELQVVKRQAEDSGIPTVASSVRKYQKPILVSYDGVNQGISFINSSDASIVDTCTSVYEELGGAGTNYDVMILSPTNSGVAGIDTFNQLLMDRYRKNDKALVYQDEEFGNIQYFQANRGRLKTLKENDLVMVTKNNYDLEIMNGSTGVITKAFEKPDSNGVIGTATIDDNNILLTPDICELLDHCYAMTVHKSQGSQFKRVILPIRSNMRIDHALLYTAITRATEQVVLVGDKTAFDKAVVSKSHVWNRTSGFGVILDAIIDRNKLTGYIEYNSSDLI